jgi:hypothetical protein
MKLSALGHDEVPLASSVEANCGHARSKCGMAALKARLPRVAFEPSRRDLPNFRCSGTYITTLE